MKKIKWGCIQPLTGGMYIGAEYAIGHPAAWIISYPGLTSVKLKKNGETGAVGNEYNLLKWCEKNNGLPPYVLFDRKPFDDYKDSNEIKLIEDSTWSTTKPDFSNTDLVISVPVCSGLSQATIAKNDTKDARNNNMIFNALYTLKVIQPIVYVFENAPTLASNTGAHVRNILNRIGAENGYSVGYFKTNTLYHDNCQNRPRTFVVFLKYRNNDKGFPMFKGYQKTTTIREYFERIPQDCTQNDITYTLSEDNKIIIDYIKHKLGSNWREKTRPWIFGNIIDNGWWEDAIEYVNNYNASQTARDKLVKYIKHVKEKLEQNGGIYSMTPICIKEDAEYIPACIFKTIPTVMHYREERLLTIREWLHSMGMPFDFELYGDIDSNAAKIGQNVPVNTAKYIVSEACRFINEFDTIDRFNPSGYIFDNTKPQEEQPKRLF